MPTASRRQRMPDFPTQPYESSRDALRSKNSRHPLHCTDETVDGQELIKCSHHQKPKEFRPLLSDTLPFLLVPPSRFEYGEMRKSFINCIYFICHSKAASARLENLQIYLEISGSWLSWAQRIKENLSPELASHWTQPCRDTRILSAAKAAQFRSLLTVFNSVSHSQKSTEYFHLIEKAMCERWATNASLKKTARFPTFGLVFFMLFITEFT